MGAVNLPPDLVRQARETERRLGEVERRTSRAGMTTREGDRLEVSWDGSTLKFYVNGALVRSI